MAKIHIIDDDPMICDTLADFVRRQGHTADHSLNLSEGLAAITDGDYALALLDVNLPDGNGLAAIPAIRRLANAPVIIIITGEGGPEGAKLAMRAGAWDYVEKPLSLARFRLSLNRALQFHEEKSSRRQPVMLRRSAIIGGSQAIGQCLEQVADAAHGDAAVLITGETGTGKELIARAIHDNSERAAGPFVAVDCASLPPSLVESVLFGHEKGAFTGADRPSEGLVRQAHLGTLFLDEVGELPLALQKKLLRVLQEQRFRPVGGLSEQESRFRLVAATNRDLDEMVRQGHFRNDLLFRLRVVTIHLPPLRERREDIEALVHARLSALCKCQRIPCKGVCPSFLETLQHYDWPGNIRELHNVIDAAFAAVRLVPTLYAVHLPVEIRLAARQLDSGPEAESSPEAVQPSCPCRAACPLPSVSFRDPAVAPDLQKVREGALHMAERHYITELIRQTGKDVGRATAASGLSRAQYYRLLSKHRPVV
ncbi:MAG: sigma-54 dependent transcriptional regulator [Desulfurivibrionaceae bacterium]